MTPCSLAGSYKRLRADCCLYVLSAKNADGDNKSICESAPPLQSTRCDIQENCNLWSNTSLLRNFLEKHIFDVTRFIQRKDSLLLTWY